MALLLSFRRVDQFTMGGPKPVILPRDLENTERTPLQWINSILDYLKWRADSCSVRGIPPFRQPIENREYIAAYRTVRDAFYAPESIPIPKLKKKSAKLLALLALQRPQLVKRLSSLAPDLDTRLLSHLSREKLAGMILERTAAKKPPAAAGKTLSDRNQGAA
jgi:hypothetical protein